MNINELMRQAKKMQDKLQQVREEAGTTTVEGTAGGGMVTVVANGKNEILSVKIDPKVVDPAEIEMLQDLLVAATNQAIARANEMMQGEIAKVTGGLQVPGMF
ncbi:MAG: YbaB/EbfC family nucleoid-associated protein [Deltaproteobacteria bacterium]|jgi:DNA-binding YbaB/EbfC family protein|nr:YbaB/EbfC family nucleoid-associated protein [Deltaproteobacteria bacterium]